jgi:hypothetical protein
MELNPFREAAGCAATQEFSNVLWNAKFHFRVHDSSPLASILSQINPVHTTAIYVRTIIIVFSHISFFSRR